MLTNPIGKRFAPEAIFKPRIERPVAFIGGKLVDWDIRGCLAVAVTYRHTPEAPFIGGYFHSPNESPEHINLRLREVAGGIASLLSCPPEEICFAKFNAYITGVGRPTADDRDNDIRKIGRTLTGLGIQNVRWHSSEEDGHKGPWAIRFDASKQSLEIFRDHGLEIHTPAGTIKDGLMKSDGGTDELNFITKFPAFDPRSTLSIPLT